MTIKSRSILNIGFNSILLLALMLGTGAVSSVTALGNVAPVAAINSLVTCSTITFAAPTNIAIGDFPNSVTVGDFNRDSNQDLAVANGLSSIVSILLGDGMGSFGTATPFAAGSNPNSPTIGDFNNDGIQDLVVANNYAGVSSNIGVSILLGNGAGSFAAPMFFSNGGSAAGSPVVGDFNEDGNQDLAVSNGLTFDNFNVSIFLGTGTGSFGTATPLSAKVYASSVVVGDFNRDGHQDLAMGTFLSGNNISVILGNGTGSFGEATVFPAGIPPGFEPSYVTVGDFNNDGNQDLATSTNHHYVSILFGNGAGSFAAPMNFDTVDTYPYGLVIGDFNGDGKQDLATANGYSTANVSILLGDGIGSFAAALDFPTGAGTVPIIIASGDFNADGKQDLVTANPLSNNISILLNTCEEISADLSITMSDTPDPVTLGGTLTYSLAVTNNGPGDATGVIVTDTLPLGVTFDPATSSPGCIELGGLVTCNLGDLANGASATVTIVVTVDAAAICGSSLTNTAAVASNESDPNSTDNSASADTTINCPVELNIRPESFPNRIRLGDGPRLVHVAILSNSSFDAPNAVDRSSLTFGHSGNEDSLHRQGRNCWRNDVNRDDLLDLVCNFVVQRTGFQPSDTVGILQGMLLDGTSFEAQDSVVIIE